MPDSDPFRALEDLDHQLEEALGIEMMNADFERGLIQGGQRLRAIIEAQGGDWSAATYVWTVLGAIVESEHSYASAAAWLDALEEQGVIERAIASLR